MIALLALHGVLACAAPWLTARLGPRVFWVLATAPVATVGWALLQSNAIREGRAPTEQWDWVPSLGMELSFRIDTLSWLLTLISGGVGALVLIYCRHYFGPDSTGLGRFAGYLTGFAGSMLGLILTDDALVLYLFWELTTVLSFLLIGHRTTSRTSRAAAMQALVVTTAGGLTMLIGLILLGESAGTYSISALVAQPPTGTTAQVAIALVLIGAVSKSALVPFHFWLPGAMAAPTPVSAYLHAAAMVKAGIYLVARLAPGFADDSIWRTALLALGGWTMIHGAIRALRQTDLKLVLAYGTVSQLGFMTMLVGTGSQAAALAGLALVLSHALFKSALFLTVGTIDHLTGSRDLRTLNGIGAQMPWLRAGAVLAGMSMAGLPLLLGFFAKEAVFGSYLQGLEGSTGPLGSVPAEIAVLAVILIGSALTFAYTGWFLVGAFGHSADRPITPVEPGGQLLHSVPFALGVAGLIGGVAATWLEPYFLPYAKQWPQLEPTVYVGGWHGFNLALLLSVTSWALGYAIYARRRVGAVEVHPRWRPSAEALYRYAMGQIDRASVELTGAVQRGSLPVTLGLILTILVVFPGGILVFGDATWPTELRFMDSPAQAAVAVVMIVASLAATRARRRMRAVLLLGVVGQGTALLFLFHGAPDLALTQVLVETVSIVVFILVLRRFTGRFPDSAPLRIRRWRALLGVLAGVTMSGLALTAATVRTEEPAATGLWESAKEFGGGKNIVNVILVDTRAWDTMGELSVVLVAATGVASLVFLKSDAVDATRALIRGSREKRYVATAPLTREGGRRWLSARELPAAGRSTLFEVVTRLIFHVIILWSLYLLFSGHNNPGGGFAAGLVAGLALAVRYLAGSRRELLAAAPVMPGLLMGAGLFLSAGFGFVSMLFGGAPLQSWSFDLSAPLLGEIHIVSSLVFDIGVYLVVIGLMLDLLRALGARLDAVIEEDEAERDRPATSAGVGP
ncbi:Na+/H+ antiporter subunit A [Demetria terragena]|uniref:Na+/H+ antiporter subunit A n=1 Tax=Demetria terragena TaxID=63959 RepID=UPI00037B7E1D|nr:Na+/H+ antiporter subunit A [Demetria terragena]